MAKQREDSLLRIALPSKERLQRPALKLLNDCGAGIPEPDDRHYEYRASGYPMISVFQRARDIPDKVRLGWADIGITGYDLVQEAEVENDPLILAYPRLGFGRCKLAVAVPDGWLDVSRMQDIAELSYEWKEKKHDLLRVTTEFPRLAKRFFSAKGVHYISVITASGAVEAAPRMRSADIICTIVDSGTTLRDNHLKELQDGTVLEAEACLVANQRNLSDNEAKRETLQELLQTIESYRRAEQFVSITANLKAKPSEDEEGVAMRMKAFVEKMPSEARDVLGRAGPTISYVYGKNGKHVYAVNVVVPVQHQAETIRLIRAVKGSAIIVHRIDFVFEDKSEAWGHVEKQINDPGSITRAYIPGGRRKTVR